MAVDPHAADWTKDPATLERLIIASLQQHDMRGVEAALTLLALADPRRADEIVTVMKAGILLAKEIA